MKKLLNKNNKGFSLTEVLVAVLVLTMAVVSASNFLVSMMRSNSMNTSVLQAYYYSVEGLEAFRNMRDTYFMNYLDFCGKGDVENEGVFGVKGGFCEEGNYVVSENNNYLNDVAFWKLEKVNDNLSDSDDSVGVIGGGMLLPGPDLGESEVEVPSKTFKRICEVKEIKNGNGSDDENGDGDGDGDTSDKLEITCTTTYEDNGKTGEVALKTILTDWKE